MNTRSILALCIVAVAWGPGVALAQLYSDNFDVDSEANWTVNDSPTDTNATFSFDYSSVGIPSAPNSDGTTLGLRLQANLSDGIFGGFSVSPTDLDLTEENYTLSFDVWSNYNGPLEEGGSGSTNLSTYGILTSGEKSNWPGNADGVWFGTTGDGGSSADWRAYSPSDAVSYQDGDPVYADPAGSRNHTGELYQVFGGVAAPAEQLTLYPQQIEATRVGTAGMAWHEAELEKSGAIVTWTMDGTLLATVDTTGMTLGGGDILFGHSDINTSSSGDPNARNLLFTLIDNVEVNLPSTTSLGDVNLDGEVNGLDVDPFVDVLLNGPFQVEADMNVDGVVNGLDVDPFVAAVVGGGVASVPEPSTAALLLLGLAGLYGFYRRRK